MTERLVVGISGASGVIYGIRLLEVLPGGPIETHLVITRAARAAVCLYPPSQGWGDIRGAQMRGQARPLQGTEAAAGWQAYRRRFSFVAQLESALRRTRRHCFTPTGIRLIDNRFGFGHTEEWGWPPA